MNAVQAILFDYPDLVFIGPLLISIFFWFAGRNLRQTVALSFSLPLGLIYLAMFVVIPREPSIDSISFIIWSTLLYAPQAFLLTIAGIGIWIQFGRGKSGEHGRPKNVVLIFVLLVAVIGHAWTRLLITGLGPEPPPTG